MNKNIAKVSPNLQETTQLNFHQHQHNHNNQDDLGLANKQVAIEFRERNSMRMLMKNDKLVTYDLCTDITQFSKYGIGLCLFFQYLKYITICFFIMGICTLPPLYSNFYGDGLLNYGQQQNMLSKLSIANQPQLELEAYKQNATSIESNETIKQNDKKVEAFVEKMGSRTNTVIIPDAIYTIIFMVFVILLRYQISKQKKSSRSNVIMPSYYTIEVSDFPSQITKEKIIQDHFEQFGKVVQCKLARQYYGTLLMHRDESNLEAQIALEQRTLEILGQKSSKKLENLQKRLLELQKDISNTIEKHLGEVKMHDEYPSLKAFVVFEEIKTKNKVISYYKEAQGNGLFYIICPCCSPYVPDELKLQKKYPLKVTGNVEEPSNIKWENLDYSEGKRNCRSFCVFLIVIGLMLFTFGIIMAANILKPTNLQNCPTGSSKITRLQALTIKTAFNVDCYCKDINPTSFTNDEELKDLCYDSYLQYVKTFILTLLTGVVVIIINYILKLVLKALGRFIRYPTLTDEYTNTAIKLFLALFINTALITLFMQANIYGFIPTIQVTNVVPPLKDMQEEKQTEFSPDFDRGWYLEVGNKIATTMGFNIVSPHFISLLLLPCIRSFRQKKADQQIIQKQMNNLYVGPDYEFVENYAMSLNTIFVCLFYSSGMPILIWFGFFSLLFQYWTYKYKLLRYNRKPPAIDSALSNYILKILPVAALLHVMVGIYMYGSPLIFPDSADNVNSQVTSNLKRAGINDALVSLSKESPFSYRILKFPVMLALLAAIGLFFLIDLTLWKFLRGCWKCCCQDIDDKLKTAPENIFKTYQEEYKKMSNKMIASYDIASNDQYSDIIKAIDAEYINQDISKQSLKGNNNNINTTFN